MLAYLFLFADSLVGKTQFLAKESGSGCSKLLNTSPASLLVYLEHLLRFSLVSQPGRQPVPQ